jgi:methionyl-tRNA formyltransferase
VRLVFAGTPRFAAVALERLVDAGHDVPLVLTQPDRPAGRGMKLVPSEVKTLALERGLAVAQPTTLRDTTAEALLLAAGADLMIVAAYGLLLPPSILSMFARGCLNIHASLLPRWRGAAPIHRALLAGDAETGVCIMRMEEGLDTGPVYRRAIVPILPEDTTGALHDRLAALGADLLLATLADLEHGTPQPVPQPDEGVTYARKIHRSDAAVDWSVDAAIVQRQIRAFDPSPGAGTTLRGEPVKIWAAQPTTGRVGAVPGEVIASDADGILVACAAGTGLLLTELQRPGGRRQPVRTFLQGCPIAPGERFVPVSSQGAG